MKTQKALKDIGVITLGVIVVTGLSFVVGVIFAACYRLFLSGWEVFA